MANILSGSEGAFYAEAFSFVSKITRKFFRYDKAYDVTMEALRHLWKNRTKFNPSRGSFEGWAYFVVKNYCLDTIVADKSLTYVDDIKRRFDNLLQVSINDPWSRNQFLNL